jgi:hypothetical protein
MRSRSVRRAVAFVIAAAVAIAAPRAYASVAATGHLDNVDFDGSPPNFTFDGTFTWDDTPFDVFGTPVNLGASFPGDQKVADGRVTALDIGDLSANFVMSLQSDSSSSGAFLDLNAIAGSAVCTQPSCVNATATFLGDVGTVDQSPVTLPIGPQIYSVDGSITLNLLLQGSGPFGLNAFLPQQTPAGDDVSVSSGDDTFYDSRQDEIVGFAAEASFAVVHEPGVTLFRALSAAEGTLPPNVVLDPPGLESVFIDITTTATYGGSVEVCVVIPDSVTIPIDQLVLLHRDGPGPGSPDGAFVDITEFTTTSPNRICGFVSSLSPFVVGFDTSVETTTTVPTTIPSTSTIVTTTTTITTTSTVSTTTVSTSSTVSFTTLVTTTTVETTTTSAPTTTIATSTTTTTVGPSTTTSSVTSTTTTTSSTTTSTTIQPTCIAAPTFESILCRLDEAIALVEDSDLSEPTKGNLLRSLQTARDKTMTAESKAAGGSTRGAKGKLKSAARSLNSVLFRLRSLNGRRRIPEELSSQLGDLVSPIQDDMKTLRNDL